MPRGDSTGPMGMGPMTGRGSGYCAGYGVPGYLNNCGGRGFGMGFGRRADIGGRRGGFRFRNRFIASGLASFGGIFAAPTPDQDPAIEIKVLNNQAEMLQMELDAIKKRLDQLNTKTQNK